MTPAWKVPLAHRGRRTHPASMLETGDLPSRADGGTCCRPEPALKAQLFCRRWITYATDWKPVREARLTRLESKESDGGPVNRPGRSALPRWWSGPLETLQQSGTLLDRASLPEAEHVDRMQPSEVEQWRGIPWLCLAKPTLQCR